MTGLETNVGLLIGAAVIIVYTTVGGLLGDVITDIVQGTILIVSLLILLVVVLASHQFSLDQIKPEQLTLIALGDDGAAAKPSGDARCVDGADPRLAGGAGGDLALPRRADAVGCAHGLLLGGGIYLVIGSVPVLLGLLGTAAASRRRTGRFLPELAQPVPRSDHVCRLMGAIVSAILSTVDTTLLAVSAIATRNIVEPWSPNLSETWQGSASAGRCHGCGGRCAGVRGFGQSIKGLVEIASSFGSSGILVALLFGLHTKFGDERAAVAALVTGGASAFSATASSHGGCHGSWGRGSTTRST